MIDKFSLETLFFPCFWKRDVSVRNKIVYSYAFNKLLFFQKKESSEISSESIWVILFASQEKGKKVQNNQPFSNWMMTLETEYTLLIKDTVGNNRSAIDYFNWTTLSKLIETNPFRGKLGRNLLTSHASLMEKVTW